MLNIPAKHTKRAPQATRKVKPHKPLYGGGVPLRGGKVGISNTPKGTGYFARKPLPKHKLGTTKYLI